MTMYWNSLTQRWTRRRRDKRRGRVRDYRDTTKPGGARDQLVEAIKTLDKSVADEERRIELTPTHTSII